MLKITGLTKLKTIRPANQERLGDDIRFDWAVTVLSLWMIGGIHLDAWAHHQFTVETFFTPWHGVLYSGFLAVAAVLVGTFVRNLWRGQPRSQALPVGYVLSLVGVFLFLAGGVGDMLWHILFGIEVDIEALLSPTHLLLALGGALIVTGPLRAAWIRPAGNDQDGVLNPSATPRVGWWKNLASLLPALLSLAMLLSVLIFFTAYANPINTEIMVIGGRRPANTDLAVVNQALGVASILVQTGLMMGVILLAVRRWALPFGSLALMLTIQTLLSVWPHEDYQLLPIAILSGLAADLLRWRLKPSATRPTAFRLFAVSVPVVFYALYFANLWLTAGLWWTVHLWAGSTVIAGVVGWLLSYAFVPPTPSIELPGHQPWLSPEAENEGGALAETPAIKLAKSWPSAITAILKVTLRRLRFTGATVR